MSMGGQGSKWRRNIPENFSRLSRAHECYRQTTEGWVITYNEREREFTFAKNDLSTGKWLQPARLDWIIGLSGGVSLSRPMLALGQDRNLIATVQMDIKSVHTQYLLLLVLFSFQIVHR